MSEFHDTYSNPNRDTSGTGFTTQQPANTGFDNSNFESGSTGFDRKPMAGVGFEGERLPTTGNQFDNTRVGGLSETQDESFNNTLSNNQGFGTSGTGYKQSGETWQKPGETGFTRPGDTFGDNERTGMSNFASKEGFSRGTGATDNYDDDLNNTGTTGTTGTTKPKLTDKIVGGAQEAMGKVLKKPAMQEKGAERKTSGATQTFDNTSANNY